jgi:hypothetical protein
MNVLKDFSFLLRGEVTQKGMTKPKDTIGNIVLLDGKTWSADRPDPYPRFPSVGLLSDDSTSLYNSLFRPKGENKFMVYLDEPLP